MKEDEMPVPPGVRRSGARAILERLLHPPSLNLGNRGTRRILKISAIGLGLQMLYIGMFSYWWLHSPVQIIPTKVGRPIRVVEFHYNKVIWYTGPMWDPAFWFVEHVCGYEDVAFAPMCDKSIIRYAKWGS